jgi:hypothetical protein
MSAKLLMDALAEMRKGTPNVDLGDMSRRMSVEPRVAAIEKMLPKKTPVDDWGWKGGKPGELTGSGLTKTFNVGEWSDPNNNPMIEALYRKAQLQLFGKRTESLSNTVGAMDNFFLMERAGIPRAYTGKIYKKKLVNTRKAKAWLGEMPNSRAIDIYDVVESLAGMLEPLTHSQRLTAIDMLPTWSRSLGDLEAVISAVDSMTAGQRLTFMQMAPTWKGDLNKLANVARNLYKR